MAATSVRFFMTKEVSQRLGVSENTLRHWRATGRGPAVTKMGGLVRYASDDLDTWIESCRKQGEAA